MTATSPVLYSADLRGCLALTGMPPESIVDAFVGALEAVGATIVERTSHCFPDAGLTCVLILSESHAVLHTWPENGTINLDIFSCSPRLDGVAAIEALGRVSGAGQASVRETPRAPFEPRR